MSQALAWYFYPRPPRGGRLRSGIPSRWGTEISIHALREEGDLCCLYCQQGKKFLSTPSARRATRPLAQPGQRSGISIHALREEGDV